MAETAPEAPEAIMQTSETKIILGISSCLLGNMVRFDGGHKHDHFLTDTLGKYVDYVPVCPTTTTATGIKRTIH